MPRFSKFPRSKPISNASTASLPLLDFLAPAAIQSTNYTRATSVNLENQRRFGSSNVNLDTENVFYTALFEASLCDTHRRAQITKYSFCSSANDIGRTLRGTSRRSLQHARSPEARTCAAALPTVEEGVDGRGHRDLRKASLPTKQNTYDDNKSGNEAQCRQGQYNRECQSTSSTYHHSLIPRGYRCPSDRHNTESSKRHPISGGVYTSYVKRACHESFRYQLSGSGRSYHIDSADFNSKQRRFAETSHLPPTFFDDVVRLKALNAVPRKSVVRRVKNRTVDVPTGSSNKTWNTFFENLPRQNTDVEKAPRLTDQIKLLTSVRELEGKLEKAKKDLARSLAAKTASLEPTTTSRTGKAHSTVVLTKEDYKNLVDLYFYSHNSRFSPESTDESPTPLLLDDCSFALSSEFSQNSNQDEIVNEDEVYESPLKQIEELIKQRQLREIAVMQVFVDLLLNDYSSNRALYEAYKQLPDPGVAYLPRGIIRLFLQRMSTPWTLSEKSMLRYLSLIDDMQKAKIRISVSEWSSAVYLAGRAFTKVTDQEVKSAFKIWQAMEHEAGVRASHVTFNILFDVAVRSGKFALGETVLREMQSRNLRLNRLGRVSLMYYHGLRKDGDGVRKAYRDFVDAGEIVDTLVLNCVIASLLNAQEPQAAEQVYARMKNMQSRLREGVDRDDNELLYQRYPDPGANTIEHDMASNHLGRILAKAPYLKKRLPENHRDLQQRMPLTPDHITFRAMVAYHSTVSGDLDRLTILLQDMTDFFQLPLQTITFQLLFKGFTIHGPINGPNSAWSMKRLDMCWNACRAAIKDTQMKNKARMTSLLRDISEGDDNEDDDSPDTNLTLPSITQVNAVFQNASPQDLNLPLSRPPPRRLSDWSEFVLDLAAFPRERLKRLERFHATMFDAEDMKKPHEKPGVHTFQSPFFQSTAYTAPEPYLDTEEGEYELPNPSDSDFLQPRSAQSNPETNNVESMESADALESSNSRPHQVAATRALVCWLLRAYTRISKSRLKVEEVWGQVRKLYKPKDANEKESVVRVLSRCLRDCDMERGH